MWNKSHIPRRALDFSPKRCTPEDVSALAKQLGSKQPIDIIAQIPPKTGRRYIVVGGAGFLGGWIVVQLLRRGEDPRCIRVLDIRLPVRHDLKFGVGKDVHYIQVDVSNAEAVQKAFTAPWPEGSSTSSPISIFHTAANIRFYERSASLIPNSTRVNVDGTQNIIDSARSIGASTLVYTSSGSVGVHSSRFLLRPWQSEPEHFVQAINDDDNQKRVRASDKLESGSGTLRTGCIRPGNGVFGPGGDMLCGAYLVRQFNPTWISNIVSHFRLRGEFSNPDIGGQSFTIADPGVPPTYGDVYRTLETLSNGQTYFPEFIPPINGDLVNLQPSLFNLTMVHLIFDDSRARLPPEKGGLGYKGAWTTLEGLHKTYEEHVKGMNASTTTISFAESVSVRSLSVDMAAAAIPLAPMDVLNLHGAMHHAFAHGCPT
ncbi:NAD(P)-binding protein [Gymnopus androsaceus JB14]|uniref:NAD(P)-binding protein n=1 Tax=Gymnopus androsaceus JB14 TaxID=1447944 RepID=A0A6A4HFD4_9AGAR|nr:NAD(P)-binding protein [Gymnopus androsaceus JB14]